MHRHHLSAVQTMPPNSSLAAWQRPEVNELLDKILMDAHGQSQIPVLRGQRRLPADIPLFRRRPPLAGTGASSLLHQCTRRTGSVPTGAPVALFNMSLKWKRAGARRIQRHPALRRRACGMIEVTGIQLNAPRPGPLYPPGNLEPLTSFDRFYRRESRGWVS
jgi:hypothetical protein